jgi:hypothetical protein
LDADDFWFPQKLEKQVAWMEKCGNDTGLVYCWSSLIDMHGEFVGSGYPQTVEGRSRRALVLGNVVGNGSAPLLRAAALEKLGLYLTRDEQGGAQGCEDWDLHLRIAEHFRIHVVPEYLLAYRQTSSSMSVNAENMAASFAVVMRRARERNRDLPSSIFRLSGGRFYLNLVQKCYHWGYNRWCLRYLREAVRADPALFLTTGVYRTFIRTLLNAISDRIFENIERRRWSAALDDGG